MPPHGRGVLYDSVVRGFWIQGTDTSPGVWEAASPEAYSSSVISGRFKLNTLHHQRNPPVSVSFSVTPEQGHLPLLGS